MESRLTKTVKIVVIIHLALLAMLSVWEFFQRPKKLNILKVTLQRSEVGGQRSEDGGQRSEVGGQRSEDGGQRSEVVQPKTQNPKPKPSSSSWKPRSAADIRKSALLKPTQPRTPTQTRTIDTSGLSRLQKDIRAQAANISASARTTSGVSPSTKVERYLARVSALLYQAWKQPTRSEVTGNPVVVVQFRIVASGQVIGTTIQSRSGQNGMDKSIVALLRRLPSFPSFAQYGLSERELTVHIDFQLD